MITMITTKITAGHGPVQRWFYLIGLSLIWGSSYILIKKGLQGFGYAEAATVRLMAAGLVALPFGIPYLKKIPLRRMPMVVVSGLLSMLMPAYLFSLSQQHIQSSVAGIMIAMTPSFTLLFSVFFFKRAYGKIQIAGLVLGLLCSVVLSFISSGSTTLSLNVYVLPIILATLCYGLNINLVKQYLADIPALQLAAVAVSINGLLAFVFMFVPNYEQFHFGYDTLPSLAALVTLGLLATALAQIMHNKLISLSSPLFASATTYLIPVVAILWGIADHESLSVLHFLAAGGTLLSVYMIRKEKP